MILIILGVCITSGLLSIRSWYKPSIELDEISPITVKVEKDVEVIDIVKTNKNKEKAKIEAIQNTRRRRILEVDSEAYTRSVENLEFLIKLSRQEINNIPKFRLLNSNVSAEAHDELRKIDEGLWKEFNALVLALPESIENEKYKKPLNELNQLPQVEREKFIEDMNSLRLEDTRSKDAIESLGRSFFENLKKVNSELLFIKATSVQRKLLELGVVSGLPRDQIRKNIRILFPQISRLELSLIQDLIDESTIPNIVIDWQKVRQIEQEAMDAVNPETVVLKTGTILARKGEETSEQNYYALKQLNRLHPKPDWNQILDNLFWFSLCIFLFALIVITTKVKKFTTQEIIMVIAVSSCIAAITALISLWGINKLILAPLAALSMLLTVFYAPITAGVVSTLMAVFLMKGFDLNLWQVLPLYTGAIYGIILARKAHQREDLTKAGSQIAFAQAIVFALTIVTAVETFEVLTVVTIALLYALGGILSGLITIAALPYLESSFKLLTPFRLVELSNPNQPLLKVLREKAPGTYEHTLSVASFAEQACRSIGGNVELTRVGILYHDVGKSYKPDYFIENQMGKPNPHTTLDDPLKSAEIIIEHVPEGIRLAKKYNLPQAIIDFIPMHQGTTVTGYFHHLAEEKFGADHVNDDDYRYPGPSPNSKETGIAMLADAIEAALQSIKDYADEAAASEMINKIIDARIKDGELDNTGLDSDELAKISEAFLKTWKSKHHTRVQYPEKQQTA